jgi:hypothetical protein
MGSEKSKQIAEPENGRRGDLQGINRPTKALSGSKRETGAHKGQK